MGLNLHIRSLGRALAACRKGNVAIMTAMFLPVIVGGAGFGVETTYWYYKRLALQSAADAAAYSGALEKRSGATDTEVTSVATATVNDNGFSSPATNIAVTPATINGGGTVQVVLRDSAQRFFTAMFVSSNPQLVASATATYNSAADACILALHPTASKAANFSGSSGLTLTGCSVMSNSNASDALNVQGAALLSTTCAIAVGGVSATSGLTETECTSPVTGAPSVADPFADLPVPTPTGGCLPDTANNTTISPGRYCNGLTIKNTVTMSPGVYYIESHDFAVSANAVLSAPGVTIYLTGGAHADIPANGTVTMSAPTSGTYSGVLFFGDRSGTGVNKFNGTATSKMTGAIYFASQDIQYNGNFSGINGCTQVVGSTVTWTGNTTIGINCSAFGMRTLPVLTIVRLTA